MNPQSIMRRSLKTPGWPAVFASQASPAKYPSVATCHLRFDDPQVQAEYRFRPGQFNMLYVPGAGEIAISLSGKSSEAGTWAHTIRTAGNVTGSIARMAVGGSLGLRGPYGSWWPLDDCEGADVVLIAGGIGLPPLRPAIDHLLSAPSATAAFICCTAHARQILCFTLANIKLGHGAV